MAATTKISWCDATFNPWIGCSRVHEGCAHCYAEADQADRRKRVVWGPHGTRSRTSDAYWRQPLKWDREAAAAGERRRVFCASLSDIFEDWKGPIVDAKGLRLHNRQGEYVHLPDTTDVPPLTMADLRRGLFALIDRTPNLDWLLLTKRPENVRRMWAPRGQVDGESVYPSDRYRKNVWLLTSISDQPTADKMVPELLACRDLVPVLGLSCEPLLGPIDLTKLQTSSHWPGKSEPSKLNALLGYTFSRRKRFVFNGFVEEKGEIPFVDMETGNINWVISGGESGPHARPMDVAWVRSLVEQCKAASVPAFVKQLGNKPYDSAVKTWSSRAVQFSDPKGGDPSEWEESLRVRQFPQLAEAAP